MGKTNVLILAGGTLPEDLKQYSSGHDNRALLKIGEKYMVEYVAEALRGSGEVGRVMAVGMKEPLEKALGGKADEVMEARDTMLENIRLGLDYFQGAKQLLISTCDIPLITPEIVNRFLEACNKTPADVYYPVIEKKFNDEKYPATKRTYFKLRDGTYTGGNLVMLNPEVIRKNWSLLEQAIAARKSPFKLLSMIGFGFIIKYLFHRLTLADAERTVASIVGCRGRAVPVPDPEIGIDVDKESDYVLVKEILERA